MYCLQILSIQNQNLNAGEFLSKLKPKISLILIKCNQFDIIFTLQPVTKIVIAE